MTTFRCEKFPEGKIRTTAGIVPFSGGLAVVDDPEVAQALREVPEVFGVAEVTEPPAPEACPLCGARQNVETTPTAPEPVRPEAEPVPQSTADSGAGDTGDGGLQQFAGDGHTGDQGEGDDGGLGDEGLADAGDTPPPVLPERPADSATRGDWLVYLSAVLGKPQSEFKGLKLPELKALAPNE